MSGQKLKLAEALLPEGWARDVLLEIDEDGGIAVVTPDSSEAADREIAGIALPGIPNVHSHAHQRAMAGLAEKAGPGADSFWTWREVMYGFLAKMTPEDLQAIAAQLYVEMLKAGYTAVGEFQYLHHQPDGSPYEARAEMTLRCLAGSYEAGIGFTALPVLYACGGFGGQAPAEGQRRFLNDAEGFQDILEALHDNTAGDPDRNTGIAPHSLRAVTSELLVEVLAGLDTLDNRAPIHIHIAEQVKEVADCETWSGQRPVQWLLDNLPASSRWCAIHATHMTQTESEMLAERGVVAGLCPTTEANLGDGIFDAPVFLEAGGAIALGSDSHISLDPAEEIRMLEYSQRLKLLSRNVLADGPGASTGRSLLDRALAGGAQALGRPLGKLAPGHRADLLVLDRDHPALAEREGDALLDSWIFAAGRDCVDQVFVGGKELVSGGRHKDEEAILARFRRALERLQD